MYSHLSLPCEPGMRPAGIGQRLARRAQAFTAPFWPARHQHQLWADPLSPGRVPEESYRDYMFRKAIWR
jgi:hypothetical protein